MRLNKKPRLQTETKVLTVKEYLMTGTTLREIARRFGVSHATVWHWVKRYKEQGKRGLRPGSGFIRNQRIGKNIETQVVLMKERWPGLSIRKAQIMMNQAGCAVSTFLIWRIWHDYGFIRKKSEDPLNVFVQSTPAIDEALNEARVYTGKKNYRKASAILNGFPSIPRIELLSSIPEKYLSPRRQLDRLFLERREGSYADYAARAKRIGKILEKDSFFYSSIIANFLELDALDIIGQPEHKAKVLNRMAVKMRLVKSYPLRFLFAFEQAYTAVYLLQISNAIRFLEICRRLVYLLPYPYYQEMFGALLVLVGKFKSAGRFYWKAFDKASQPTQAASLILQIARYAHCYAGEYAACGHMMATVRKTRDRKTPPSLKSAYDLTNAYLSYGQGHLAEAANSFVRSLETAYEGKHINRIYAASVGLAGVAMAMNNNIDAKLYLQKYLPLMKKNRLLREELLLKCFLNHETDISAELKQTPPFCLLDLLKRADRSRKISDYRKSFRFASSHGLAGLFHRWIVFFPASIVNLLDRGKKTRLPRPILNFPVFNQNTPVYNIKFLGRMVLAKNQRRLTAGLTPQEKAFLIHVAMRADAPGKSVLVNDLCQNFWPKSPASAAFLSHLLVRLKKKLHLPSYLLAVSPRISSIGSRLINNGVYFVIDYNEFTALLTQANTLKLSGEWLFSRREYLRAFRLFRGAPFEKMYDPWSEQMRRVILNKLENEAVHFSNNCLEYKNKEDVKRLLAKVLKIIPHSTELTQILEGCN